MCLMVRYAVATLCLSSLVVAVLHAVCNNGGCLSSQPNVLHFLYNISMSGVHTQFRAKQMRKMLMCSVKISTTILVFTLWVFIHDVFLV